MSSGPRTSGGGARKDRRTLLIGVASGVGTLAVLALVAVAWALFTFYGDGPRTDEGGARTVVLRRGAGLSEIAATLDRAGVVNSGSVFVAAAQLLGAAGDLKPGEYAFASGSSMANVLDKIRRGQIVRHYVTIPEGVTSEMAVEILMRSPVLEGEVPVPPEGSILPETYQVQRGDQRAAVLERMMDSQDRLMAELWPGRARDLPFTTREQAITLASIVEKETGVASERPRVASVFVNRLRQGMRLESDPTIIYGVSRGRPLVDAQGRRRGIRRSELQRETPYNTYFIAGLPPTPIANPGRDAIAAVLNPPPGNDLFFVANGTGGHAFAATYAEHVRNVERWRGIEAQRLAQQRAPAAAPGS